MGLGTYFLVSLPDSSLLVCKNATNVLINSFSEDEDFEEGKGHFPVQEEAQTYG